MASVTESHVCTAAVVKGEKEASGLSGAVVVDDDFDRRPTRSWRGKKKTLQPWIIWAAAGSYSSRSYTFNRLSPRHSPVTWIFVKRRRCHQGGVWGIKKTLERKRPKNLASLDWIWPYGHWWLMVCAHLLNSQGSLVILTTVSQPYCIESNAKCQHDSRLSIIGPIWQPHRRDLLRVYQ